MRLIILYSLTFVSNLYSQPIMNIHLNNGKVIQKYIGGPGIGMPYFNVHVGNNNWLNNNLNYNSLTDQNGNIYKTINIGSQEWMAENLRSTSFSNGDPIPNNSLRLDSLQIYDLPITSSLGWFFVQNDSTLNIPYGKLYTPKTVIDNRNVCPTGWHVPTFVDWYLLFNNYGGISNSSDEITTANNQYWHDGSIAGSNLSGFSALPSGGNQIDEYVGSIGIYYTSNLGTGVDAQKLYYFEIKPNIINTNLIELNNPNNARFGGAVRCVKN